MGFGVAQKIESRARHLNNEWIDFEKCEPIARLSVSCQRSRAQSNDTHANAAAFVSLIQGHSGARLRPIVSSGFAHASRFEDFDPVHDRSIDEVSACGLICGSYNIFHPHDAIEISHCAACFVRQCRQVRQKGKHE